MPLTDTAIRNAKPREKPYKLADGRGMYLLVKPSGSKLWRLDFPFNGKRQTLALGIYPDVPLAGRKLSTGEVILGARDLCHAARERIASGINPTDLRRLEKKSAQELHTDSFETMALAWIAKNRAGKWTATYADTMRTRLAADMFPVLGAMRIGDIKAADVLKALRQVEARGALVIAKRLRQATGGIFRYAVGESLAERDVTVDLRDALATGEERHHASIIEPRAVGELMRAIDGYTGTLVTRAALRISPLVFLRSGELRRAAWAEIDLEQAEWRIPAERMKAKVPHIVPLSDQAIAILKELQPYTGRGRYVFPGRVSESRPMSENTVLAALRGMGYTKEQMTPHGFRSMASTLLNELSWNKDAIERQLAHGERNKVRAAYNYAEHLPLRRKMMQAWADHLDGLRDGNIKVVAIRHTAA
ncbi:MAG: tyrosine-type recombinase/integrase [Pseudomonadota bacterium]